MDKTDDKEIALALLALLETQDEILKMLWSVRRGITDPGFLDDSNFQALGIQRNLAKAALRKKLATK